MKHYSPYFRGEEKNIFDATWQYMKDHCDVTPEGNFFIKFHIKDKEAFEKKIRSRMKGVHRDRISETLASDRKEVLLEKHAEGKKKKVKEVLERQAMIERIKKVGELNRNRNLSFKERIMRYFK